jgi:uncharacterized protein with ATP-grasp and redox domains
MRRLKKHEIHLPLNYGNGEPIEQEKIMSVREELLAAFGSFVVPDRKMWKYDGVKYVEIMKIEIITTGDKVIRKRLKDFKEHLRKFLRQHDILITTQPIRTI